MPVGEYKIYSLGTDAVTIEFGNEISSELNDQAVNLSNYFYKNPFAGFIEAVPAYASLTVFFDVLEVRRNFPAFPTAFACIRQLLVKALRNLPKETDSVPRLVEIPVDFSPEFAPDLEFVAAANDLSPPRVIEIFTAQTYRVYMLGFLPGFAYMGEVAAAIATPRKPSPRTFVPKGSVGIAGRQTGIYPTDSPGGWQLIGKTDFVLFTPDDVKPSSLNAGDLVRFYAT
jgi:inhibitor of KinA